MNEAGTAVEATPLEDFDSKFRPFLIDGSRLARPGLRDSEEAALRTWRRYAHFHGDDRMARAWFITIVTNRCRSRLRSSWWRLGRATGADPTLERLVARGREERVEFRADVAVAVNRLTWGQRAVLFLYYELDQPKEAVAGILGIRVGTVKSRLNRTVRALRSALEEDG